VSVQYSVQCTVQYSDFNSLVMLAKSYEGNPTIIGVSVEGCTTLYYTVVQSTSLYASYKATTPLGWVPLNI